MALDKQKEIIEIRLEQLKSMDRDITKLIFTFLGAWGVSFFYAWRVGLLSNNQYLYPLIGAIIAIVWTGQQYSNYVLDCYNWFVKAIKEEKLLTEDVPTMKTRDAFFYKKKFGSI